MNKNYLPYYNSLNERDKTFWLGQDKETLIDHLVSNINNSEVLLSRIEKAKEYIEEPQHEMSVKTYQELLEILNGEI